MSKMLETEELYNSQLREWSLAGENYSGLKHVAIREFVIDGLIWRAQYNPKRIISSSAKVDPKSISERPCFLCKQNRPPEQNGISFKNYLILVNPYPILHHHFTIPSKVHVPQRITGKIRIMLDLAKDMAGYTLIYNGPNCGASAPDHFHFQAIPRGILPIEKHFEDYAFKETEAGKTEVFLWKNYPAHPVTLRGTNPDSIVEVFNTVFASIEKLLPAPDEPMINLLSLYNGNSWTIHIFPRKAHRPAQYFQTGSDQILISPASIDMGGILVLPREEDFNKITAETILDIFNQVSVEDPFIHELISDLKPKL